MVDLERFSSAPVKCDSIPWPQHCTREDPTLERTLFFSPHCERSKVDAVFPDQLIAKWLSPLADEDG